MQPPVNTHGIKGRCAGLVLVGLVLMFAMGVKLESLNAELQKPDPALKIVAIELADEPRAREIVRLWAQSLDAAYLSLLWDLPFILAYTTTFVLLCSLTHARLERSAPAWSQLGAFLGWFAILAAFADVLEDGAIYGILHAHHYALADPCRLFAFTKFVLIGIVLVYLLLTPIVLGIDCIKRKTHVLPG